MTSLLLFFCGLILGIFTLLGYMIWRLMRNDEWDDSNMTNALRLLSHVVLHPNDFGKMYYLSDVNGRWNITSRPFWYVNRDELSEVVKSRPPQ